MNTTLKVAFFALLLIPALAEAQVRYSYDKSGNRTKMIYTITPLPDSVVKSAQATVTYKSNPALDQVSVYPNPTTNFIQLSSTTPDLEFTATLYDMNGKQLQQVNYKNRAEINIENEKAGIYILEVKDKSYCKRWKIIKQ